MPEAPETIVPPPGVHQEKGVLIRLIPKVSVAIVLTENDVIFCLPDLNEKIDYTGVISNDPKFLKWCKDLFSYYWEKGRPVTSLVTSTR